jgi:hypothetical protein
MDIIKQKNDNIFFESDFFEEAAVFKMSIGLLFCTVKG